MLGTSTGELIFIRFWILFFRYTPCLYILAFLVSAYRAAATATVTAGPALLLASGLLLAAELAYYARLWRPAQARLADEAEHPAPATPDERRALFRRCFLHVPDLEAYLRGWFTGAPPDAEGIKRDNVREFLLWAFFERREGDENEEEGGEEGEDIAEEMEEYLQAIEHKLGRPLAPGRGDAKSLRLTFDPVRTTYRSLLWYVVIGIVDVATHVVMRLHGFEYYPAAATEQVFPPRPQTWRPFSARRSPAPGLGYWHKPPRRKPEDDGSSNSARNKADPNPVPVLFFHGIGVGLWTYATFLSEIHSASAQSIGIIAIEHLPISFRLTRPPPGKTDFLSRVRLILDHHGWRRFALASHSYGSVPTTHVLRDPVLGPRVASVVLVDPVTLMLHLPAVAHNFTRRAPGPANEWQLWYFASTDPGVAHCLGRHFFWRENILWREDLLLPPAAVDGDDDGDDAEGRGGTGWRAAVCLAGRDLIVDTAAVARHLEAERAGGIDVLMFPDKDHAQAFDDPVARWQIVDLVVAYCSR
ncbi:hypothetical protein N3K66_008494 [Trichothecium roseum]|uniref:Uncharacterized protein n=1 Tax=Trichothecium roseum TaxID=47278 RepID=A0ACC0US30_9HYPO|nr:hypothetical protein N3K66_008494 [Trichothecium roseum]